jgi:type II secretory pathway component GspD/PulD (secretin)
MAIIQNMQNQAPGPVAIFPTTVPIFPTGVNSDGGSPITIQQAIQQPVQNSITVGTTVLVPDGGTAVLGGLKAMAESRNEFGPPVLSKIPYINRLFKNVAYGRDTSNLLLMVTPRIIIQDEEQERQTGYREGYIGGQ